MATGHKAPNYWAIWGWLFILTVIEVVVIFLPLARVFIAILLISLAISKAVLVAMFFMHLRFEYRTLSLIAVVPLILGALLVFSLVPDHSAVAHRTAETIKPASAEAH
ncbi:MAG: cytochrome C oxidase subunit IV family protein [Candidatus Methylomirabilia bacterium]